MIAVIGAGAFGTALGNVMASDGSDVTLLCRDATRARAINEVRKNESRLPGVTLHKGLRAAASLDALAPADIILLAVPAQQTAQVLQERAAELRGKTLVFCAKGIDARSHALQSELAPDNADIAALSGPGFAGEIARGQPSALTLAASSPLAIRLQTQLNRPTLRLYRSDDLIGVQLGGALKNVIAIACGITIGAGLGESARAAILTRGFAEIARLAQAMGAKPDTLTGLSGFGDLALTCGSDKSRNFAHGRAVGGNAQTAQTTTEGIATAAATCALAKKFDVEMPIAHAVNDVLDGRVSVSDAMQTLLSRPPKSEK